MGHEYPFETPQRNPRWSTPQPDGYSPSRRPTDNYPLPSRPLYPQGPPTYPSPSDYPPPLPVYPARPRYPPSVPYLPEPPREQQQSRRQQPPPSRRAPRRSNTPVVLEIIGNVFGIFGIGWLVGGRTTTGLMLLVGSFLLYVFWIALATFTLGIGLLCVLPGNLVLLLISALALNSALKRVAEQPAR